MKTLLRWLTAPLTLAWVLLIGIIACILVWCTLTYVPQLVKGKRVEIEIPPYNAQEVVTQDTEAAGGKGGQPATATSVSLPNAQAASQQAISQDIPPALSEGGDAVSEQQAVGGDAMQSGESTEGVGVSSSGEEALQGALAPQSNLPDASQVSSEQSSMPDGTSATPQPINEAPPPMQASSQPLSVHPFQKYAKPATFVKEGAHKIALVVAGVGLDPVTAQLAVDNLPPAITLAFSAYAPQLPAYIQAAAQKGHETLVVIPMEPDEFPISDPGPMALLSQYTPEQNQQRLLQALQNAEGIVGVTHTMGNKMASQKNVIFPVLQRVKDKGLVWVDSRELTRSLIPEAAKELGVIHLQATEEIDEEVSRLFITNALKKLEDIALKKGSAIGIASPYPISIEQIIAWAQTLSEKGISLVPITAMIGHAPQ